MNGITLIQFSYSCTPFNELSIHSMKFMFHLHVKDIDCFMLIHPINLILHTPFWWPEESHVMPTERHYLNRPIKMKSIVSQNIIILHWCTISFVISVNILINWNLACIYVKLTSSILEKYKLLCYLTEVVHISFQKVFFC